MSTQFFSSFLLPDFLKQIFKKLNLKPYKLNGEFFKITQFKNRLLCFIIIIISLIVIFKIDIRLVILVIIILLIIFKKQIIKNTEYQLILGFGGCYNNFNHYMKNRQDNYLLIICSILINYFNIGFIKDEYIKIINYLVKDIKDMRLNSTCIDFSKLNKYIIIQSNGNKYKLNYDKLVLCYDIRYCKYINIKNIISKPPPQFYFYSIYIKLNKLIKFPKYIIGYTKASSNEYILASTKYPNKNDFINNEMKVFTWKNSYNNLSKIDKCKLNNFFNKYDIYTIGEHIDGQGFLNKLNQANNLIL